MAEHTVDWDAVIQEVRGWPEMLRTQLNACVHGLATTPVDKCQALGCRPLKMGTHPPGGWWSAKFDKALLVFQRMADFPHIRLIHVRFLDGEP